jgi:hypothetical protein
VGSALPHHAFPRYGPTRALGVSGTLQHAGITACRLRRRLRTYLVETARAAVRDGIPRHAANGAGLPQRPSGTRCQLPVPPRRSSARRSGAEAGWTSSPLGATRSLLCRPGTEERPVDRAVAKRPRNAAGPVGGTVEPLPRRSRQWVAAPRILKLTEAEMLVGPPNVKLSSTHTSGEVPVPLGRGPLRSGPQRLQLPGLPSLDGVGTAVGVVRTCNCTRGRHTLPEVATMPWW